MCCRIWRFWSKIQRRTTRLWWIWKSWNLLCKLSNL